MRHGAGGQSESPPSHRLALRSRVGVEGGRGGTQGLSVCGPPQLDVKSLRNYAMCTTIATMQKALGELLCLDMHVYENGPVSVITSKNKQKCFVFN